MYLCVEPIMEFKKKFRCNYERVSMLLFRDCNNSTSRTLACFTKKQVTVRGTGLWSRIVVTSGTRVMHLLHGDI